MVQLYLKDHFASATRPVRELKGFELVELKAGETKTVVFSIDESLLQFYNGQGQWMAEPGAFTAFIGSDSTTKRSAEFSFN